MTLSHLHLASFLSTKRGQCSDEQISSSRTTAASSPRHQHPSPHLRPPYPSHSSPPQQPAPIHLHRAPITPAPAAMDCLQATTAYINKIISNTSGIKVLLLDAETVRPLPSLCTRTNTFVDGCSLARVDSIDPALPRSLPYRPHRQPVPLAPSWLLPSRRVPSHLGKSSGEAATPQVHLSLETDGGEHTRV